MASKFYKEPGFDTIQVHGGQTPDEAHRARAAPIYASASFVFKSSAHGADMCNLRAPGHWYSRMSNPTVEVFEERMAALEGGISAVATSSGTSAELLAITNIAGAGDTIVSSRFLFPGTCQQFHFAFKKWGININWVSENTAEAYAAAIDEKTKAIFVEIISNPRCILADIPAIAKVAHDHGIPLIVDNTFAIGGYLIRPISYGADIVVHSATKWIGGHGTTVAGVVIDSGKFDWAKSGRFPSLTTPSEGFDDIIYTEAFGHAAYGARLRHEQLRDLGPSLNPFGAFLLLQGLETLSLRGQRHSDNALALAQWLEKHPLVSWVSYLGLESHGSHALAKKLLRPNAFGGMLNFRVKGGMEQAYSVLDHLRLASNLANVGDAKTLVLLPATLMGKPRQQPTKDDGVIRMPDLIRVSVGIEDISDIIADFDAALNLVLGDVPSNGVLGD